MTSESETIITLARWKKERKKERMRRNDKKGFIHFLPSDRPDSARLFFSQPCFLAEDIDLADKMRSCLTRNEIWALHCASSIYELRVFATISINLNKYRCISIKNRNIYGLDRGMDGWRDGRVGKEDQRCWWSKTNQNKLTQIYPVVFAQWAELPAST